MPVIGGSQRLVLVGEHSLEAGPPLHGTVPQGGQMNMLPDASRPVPRSPILADSTHSSSELSGNTNCRYMNFAPQY